MYYICYSFFNHLLDSYAFDENDQERVENVINNIKEKLGTKLILLITFIFAEQKGQYYECLRIKEETDDTISHFEHLTSAKKELLKYNEGDIPEGALEEFGQTLLGTEELVFQINKFILGQFGSPN